ncbi:hypothetical protein IscW_ISCW016924 [Ixodes scapularis]|uniref:Uncharacterized protein n=1 Tax=Ixodes scapularis TaxID=6945 RepID=B7PDG0_IXOSC|nr:hypothetical protein IscW_ISCW016924 [Ixodes scapularis]|eukprot:XP_002410794.1 hypothetical protein IscW_ISCW016924 [Ixodes scapularis]
MPCTQGRPAQAPALLDDTGDEDVADAMTGGAGGIRVSGTASGLGATGTVPVVGMSGTPDAAASVRDEQRFANEC